jgi:hypothetical protein
MIGFHKRNFFMRIGRMDRRAVNETDLLVSTEDILAPILVVVFAALLGLAAVHFDPGLAKSMAAKVTHLNSHMARG